MNELCKIDITFSTEHMENYHNNSSLNHTKSALIKSERSH